MNPLLSYHLAGISNGPFAAAEFEIQFSIRPQGFSFEPDGSAEVPENRTRTTGSAPSVSQA